MSFGVIFNWIFQVVSFRFRLVLLLIFLYCWLLLICFNTWKYFLRIEHHVVIYVCTVLIILVLFHFFTTGNPCNEPEKPFPCKTSSTCIPMSYVCDDNEDCRRWLWWGHRSLYSWSVLIFFKIISDKELQSTMIKAPEKIQTVMLCSSVH